MIFATILIIVSFLVLYIIVGVVLISNADDKRFNMSDSCVSFMNDLYHSIKFAKLYSWKIPLMNRINKYRIKERKYFKIN